jgi:hypothetical protein
MKNKNVKKLNNTKKEIKEAKVWSRWIMYTNIWTSNSLVNGWKEILYKLYKINNDLRSWIKDIKNLVFKWWVYFTDDAWNPVSNSKIEKILNYNLKFKDFIELAISHYIIFWELYILKLRNIVWECIWLQILDCRTVKPEWDKFWNIIKYKQKYNQEELDNILKEDIIKKFFDNDLDNIYWWLSPLEPVIYDILWDDEAAISN